VTDSAKDFWDEWRGSLDGRPTFWLKRLLYIPVWKRAGKWLGCRVDLHKFIGADDDGCFHSHPAWAVRIILWGGYSEEIFKGGMGGFYRTWFPGDIGIIRPEFAHRVQGLVNGRSSYSLWLRGPICADVKLLGDGWPDGAPTISPQGGKS
jgi:hypothetical protein